MGTLSIIQMRNLDKYERGKCTCVTSKCVCGKIFKFQEIFLWSVEEEVRMN